MASVLLLGCKGTPARPHLVLIVLDTVRADHTTLYGYARDTTPFLQRLAAEGRVFDRAWSASSWTLPSHASIFTGLPPGAHGATGEGPLLDARFDTLAERLGAAGYETLAVVANAMLEPGKRLDQGFERYQTVWLRRYDATPDPTPPSPLDAVFGSQTEGLRPQVDENAVRELERCLATRDSARPLFLFVNLVGAHSPYDSSGRFRDRWRRHPELALDSNDWGHYYAGTRHFSDAELEQLVDLYDAEIRAVDDRVERIVALLERAGLWRDSVVVITSDHGENFGDHGLVGHLFSLHESLTRVPLLVRGPGVPVGRDARPAAGVDLYPTLLRLGGVAAEPPAGARDLLGPAPDPARPVRLELWRAQDALRLIRLASPPGRALPAWLDRRLVAVVSGDQKLIAGSDGSRTLYDLHSDPLELRDRAADPALAARRAALEALARPIAASSAAEDAGAAPEIDAETLEALRALGYR